MSSKVSQTEIQPLSMKALRALAIALVCITYFGEFSPVTRQRKDLGSNFPKRTSTAYLPNFIEIDQVVFSPGEIEHFFFGQTLTDTSGQNC